MSKNKEISLEFVDQVRHFSIHEDDFKILPVKSRKILEDSTLNIIYRKIQDGYTSGNKFDKIDELKKKILLLKDEKRENIRCLIYDDILNLLLYMNLEQLDQVDLSVRE